MNSRGDHGGGWPFKTANTAEQAERRRVPPRFTLNRLRCFLILPPRKHKLPMIIHRSTMKLRRRVSLSDALRCLVAATVLMTAARSDVLRGVAAAESSALPPIERAAWIWGDLQSDGSELRLAFTLEGASTAACVLITADNGYELYVNGTLVGHDVGPGADVWGSLEKWEIADRLVPGPNALGIRAICLGGSRGVVAALRVETEGAETREWVTDATWRVAATGDPEEYSKPDYDQGEQWVAATALGPMGMAPWGKLEYAGSEGGRRQGVATMPVVRKPDAGFRWPSAVAFLADDCSVYVPLNADAWGVCFRIHDWARAYTMFDLPCPSQIGRKLCVLDPVGAETKPRVLVDAGQGVIGSPSVSFDGRSIYVAMALDGSRFSAASPHPRSLSRY